MANVGKKRKKNGFTMILNSLFEDETLSYRAKGILGYLLSRPDNWKFNKTDLVRRSAEGRDAVYKAIDELKEKGYLHIYRNKTNEGVFDGWIWEYDDEPFALEHLKNRTTEKQPDSIEIQAISRRTENPSYGKTVVRDSSTYNNTVFNNTDLTNTESKEIKTNKLSTGELEKEFELLWKVYPRKLGKKKAFDSFKKARKVKKIPYETIQKGLYRYIEYLEIQGMEEQYIMHGSTWFNQEKWQDEYEAKHFKKKPKLSTFSQTMLSHMDDPDDFINMLGVEESYEQRRNRKIIDVH